MARERTTVLAALWCLAVGPALAGGLAELFHDRLVWRIRIVDFVDMAVVAPLLLATFLVLHWLTFRPDGSDAPGGWRPFASMALIATFAYGHAMHATANTINTYATEVHRYRDSVPDDLYELIYFLDEGLGHWLSFLPVFLLLSLWAGQLDAPAGRAQPRAAGGLFGIVGAIVLIESTQVWLIFALAPLLLVAGMRAVRAKGAEDGRRPVADFAMAAGLGVLIGAAVYLAVFGGFVEPSAARRL